ncbi:hypothetical protein IQ07DRAFT_679960 [Pyrenochaeta sp. DS3sAY3a]|nr:hypothetical protein IQ07DRAFT_679960 [Pyrenochaeta sp. DS3sAY3a]
MAPPSAPGVHLEDLPPEILFRILSFTEPVDNPTASTYPLNALAATNKHLETVVEEYARLLLKKDANFIPPKKRKIFTCRRKWLGGLCQFCRTNSTRGAILYPLVTCCVSCDRRQYPKLTMSGASSQYGLSKLDLFTPNVLHPDLPALTHGNITIMGGDATMILESDVVLRQAHVLQLLRKKEPGLKGRIARHNRIATHLCIAWDSYEGCWSSWDPDDASLSNKALKSFRTPASRFEYAKLILQQEWAGMGMSELANSEDVDEYIKDNVLL